MPTNEIKRGNLILGVPVGCGFHVGGDDGITVEVIQLSPSQVRFSIKAPENLKIERVKNGEIVLKRARTKFND